MTEPERVDGRIRDLAELCSRHGTPCADGLLAEIGRLRTEIESARMRRDQAYVERDAALAENARLERRAAGDDKGLNRWCNYQDRLFAVMTSDEIRAFEERLTADGWWNEPLCRHEGELARTEGNLGVAIREAAAARDALRFAREFIDAAPCQVPGIDTAVVLSMIEGALDQRLTQ